jgi:hypothetical protein
MQIISPFTVGLIADLAPAQRVAEVQRLLLQAVEPLREFLPTLILLIALGQVVLVLSYWIASKFVAPEESRFINALKTYVFYILMAFLLLFAGGFAVISAQTLSGRSHAVGIDLISVGLAALFGVLLLASLFAVPMNVYKMSFPRSLGFVALVLILSAAGHLAVTQTIGREVTKPDGPLQQIFERLRLAATGAPPPAAPGGSSLDGDERTAGDATKSIGERQAALTDLYQRLDSMYESLPPGQSPARAEYDMRKARYEHLLSELREDAHRAAK